MDRQMSKFDHAEQLYELAALLPGLEWKPTRDAMKRCAKHIREQRKMIESLRDQLIRQAQRMDKLK